MSYQIIHRMDGTKERICEHGIGHAWRLTKEQKERGSGIHGCDGCCGTKEWMAEEMIEE